MERERGTWGKRVREEVIWVKRNLRNPGKEKQIWGKKTLRERNMKDLETQKEIDQRNKKLIQ